MNVVKAPRFISNLQPRLAMPEPGSRLTWLLGRGNVKSDRESFFVWQERKLDWLLSWGLGNVVGGLAVVATRPGIQRAIGVQAIAWGLVDAVIAIYAQCVARKHALSARSGMYGARHIQHRARRFERLLAIQTGADIIYLTVGSIVAAKSQAVWVRGTAIGVIIQSSALLMYDLALSIRMLTRPELRHQEFVID